MNMIETQELSITHPQFIQPTMMQLNPLHDPVVRNQVKMEAVNLSILTALRQLIMSISPSIPTRSLPS